MFSVIRFGPGLSIMFVGNLLEYDTSRQDRHQLTQGHTLAIKNNPPSICLGQQRDCSRFLVYKVIDN